MLDFTENLSTLGFECGLSENEKHFLFLRARSAGLTVCGCGHAAFFCRLANSLRESIWRTSQREQQGLKIGILGGGHICKQLALVLIEVSGLKPSNINISTRRPETLEEFSRKGVKCYYDNCRLAIWADVLFLCCLPTHLPQVSVEIHSHLPQNCLVYSFISAVLIHRLAQLLGHSSILRPQYEFVACDCVNIWLPQSHVTAALKDPEIITASCPLSMGGGLSLDQKWVSAVLYSLLNMCTTEGVRSSQALQLINELFHLKGPNAFTCRSFVNSSYASTLTTADELFPRINLVDAQSMETPLTCYLSGSEVLRDCISATYHCTLVEHLTGKKTDERTKGDSATHIS